MARIDRIWECDDCGMQNEEAAMDWVSVSAVRRIINYETYRSDG